MNESIKKSRVLQRIALIALALLATGVSGKAELQIDKAYCGASNSWCDVTAFLQKNARGNFLGVEMAQPFDEIGGDPAPSQTKQLVIDYHYNQVAYRLVLKEQYPIAFAIKLPSSEAAAPGKNPEATELMKAATAPGASVRIAPARVARSRAWSAHFRPVYLGWGLALILIIGAIVAGVRRLIRSRRSQRFLLIASAVLATAVALFYLEEDWRGKRAWEKCQIELEAKGIVLDWQKYIPPAVPDDQNFFMASTNILIRFKRAQTDAEIEMAKSNRWLWLSGTSNCPAYTTTRTNPLKVATIVVLPPGDSRVRGASNNPDIEFGDAGASAQMQAKIQKTIGRSAVGATGSKLSEVQLRQLSPARISVQSGTTPSATDLAALVPENLETNLGRLQIAAANSPGAFDVLLVDANVISAADYLKWSEQFVPAFGEIREALKRPYAVLPGDYSVPYLIPTANFVTMRALAQMLSQRAQCHLLLHNPDGALQDLTLVHEVCRILQRPPTGKPETLVEAMINVAIKGLYVNTISDGLRWREWQKPQLEALQAQLQATDLPVWVVQAFHDELAADVNLFEATPADKLVYNVFAGGKAPNLWERLKNPLYLYLKFAPRGWVYQNLAHIGDFELRPVESFNGELDTFSPGVAERANREVDRFFRHGSPYSYLAAMALPNFTKAIQTTAYNQTLVNEAQIACALERFRQIDGEYPATLDALVPSFIEKLPHDIIGGQPLHYRRTDDGKFLLYSVGWDEVDEGGKVALNRDGAEDRTRGDWVWKN